MKNNNHTPPAFGEGSFHCPYCNTYAHQRWSGVARRGGSILLDQYAGQYRSAICFRCDKCSLWDSKGKMLVPNVGTAPLPSEDMPVDVKEIYEEARQVQPFSPRAAAALLRVALEKLTEHLGEKKGNLNTRIGNLKEKGLPEKVIQSLDIVRITANEGGSHAGQIDLTGEDNQEIVNVLFSLVNYIVEYTITKPKDVDNWHEKLPKDKKAGIKNRDNNN